MTVPAGFGTMPKSFDDQGFQIFPAATAAPGSSSSASTDDGSVDSKGQKGTPGVNDHDSDAGEGRAPNLVQAPRLLGSLSVGLVVAALCFA